MGKVKVRTLGNEQEENQKNELKKKKEAKKAIHVPGMKGGERVISVGPSEEELARLQLPEQSDGGQAKVEEAKEAPKEEKKEKKAKFKKAKRLRSKSYQLKASMVDKSKQYSISEAIELLEKMQSPAAAGSRSGREKSFDETVELHINATNPRISGEISLPHGTGKKIRVAIATDELLAEVEKGKVDFDILLSHPQMMPKLAKVAKILGPKGLMPNPKNGTVTANPEEAAKKYEGGLVFFKTEAKAPLLHLSVGKLSFGKEKLIDNIKAMMDAIKKEEVKKAFLKSTMSPAIKLSVDK